MEVETDRQAWLDSLKAGDEVAYQSNWSNGEYRIAKVFKRTPSGRIVCGHTTWRKDGHAIGSDYSSPGRLVQVTEKIRESVLTRSLVDKFRNLKWQHVSLDKLVAINQILYREEQVLCGAPE